MIDLSTVILSRMQFAFTISFHGIFPTLNIGLGMFLVYWEYLYLKTNDKMYLHLCQFWTKIFALSFGMGVVSGVVLAYELGANFSPFMYFSGNVLGPLMMLETATAFFLEAGFLGVMLFGWNKVSKRVHFLSTVMVSLGTIISLFWIMSANSFMQTPVNYFIENNVLVAKSWVGAIFNPSFVLRSLHMLLASVLSTSFVILGVASYFFLKNRHTLYAKASFFPALYTACLISLLQLFAGDLVGLMMYKHQPIKTAAIEANWETRPNAPLVLFGIPDGEQMKNHYAIEIPGLASFINTHDFNTPLLGLKDVPKEDRPPVKTVFFSFRVMVGIGLWLIFLSYWGLFRRSQLKRSPWLLKAFILSIPLGFVATVAGWITSEVGRQPWVIYNLMRTKDSVSNIPPAQVLASLTLIFILYLIFFVTYLIFVTRIVKQGPKSQEPATSIGYMLDTFGEEDD